MGEADVPASNVVKKATCPASSAGSIPSNANGNPFAYETWTDTTYLGSDGMKVDYFVRITDVDEDSPSFEVSFTSAI